MYVIMHIIRMNLQIFVCVNEYSLSLARSFLCFLTSSLRICIYICDPPYLTCMHLYEVYINVYIIQLIYMHLEIYISMRTHKRTYLHMHTQTHAHLRVRTHKRTHLHMHTRIYARAHS